MNLGERVHWFKVVADLRARGLTLTAIAEHVGMARKTVEEWAAGAHPRHADGERLAQFWMQETAKDRAALPIAKETEFARQPNDFLREISADVQVRMFEFEQTEQAPTARRSITDFERGASAARRLIYELEESGRQDQMLAAINASRAEPLSWWSGWCSVWANLPRMLAEQRRENAAANA